jgi:putative transcriptional regulator
MDVDVQLITLSRLYYPPSGARAHRALFVLAFVPTGREVNPVDAFAGAASDVANGVPDFGNFADQRGIWRASELRRLLAEADLEISGGKMSHLWSGRPISVRLDDLEVICQVLDFAVQDAQGPAGHLRQPHRRAGGPPRAATAGRHPGPGSPRRPPQAAPPPTDSPRSRATTSRRCSGGWA